MSRKLSITLKSALLCCCVAATASYGQLISAPDRPNTPATPATPAQHSNGPRLKGVFTVRVGPGQTPEMARAMASTVGTAGTLPLFLFSVESNRDNNFYTGVMVGRDPFNGGGRVTVDTPIIPLVIVTNTIGTTVDGQGTISTKAGRTVFDPTIANTHCLSAPNNVPFKLTQQSPIFRNAHFNIGGTDVGFTQYIDAFQRANFWNVIDRNSYHVWLSPRTLAPIVLNIPANQGLALATTALGSPAFCAPLGIVNIDTFDGIITNQLLPLLKARGVNPATFPIFILSNVVESFTAPTDLNGCCVVGYHGTSGFPIQTYSPSDFDTTGLFGGPSQGDTVTLAHEVGEWVNDPFGNNPTPRWGHVGQASGCQGNLEVGDPLSGTNAPPIFMPNGFTYHLQELAFFSWFFQTPSIGIHGWFSNNDTFTHDAGPPCH